MTTKRRRLTVFFSYSHKDEALRDELDAHLAMLKNSKTIQTWHDRKIPPGSEWDPQIAEELDGADLVLLLISSDFLSSNFCYGKEMKRAIERHVAGEAPVVPIALRPCDCTGAPFSTAQGLPKDFRWVTTWPNRDEAFTDIAKGIRWAVEQLAGHNEPGEISASFDPSPKLDQPGVSMSLALQGAFLGKPVNYASSAGELDECRIDSGTSVNLAVSLDSLLPAGYAGWDTHVYCPTMMYEQTADVAEEVVWPDSAFPARAFMPPGSIHHAAAGGIGFHASYYLGILVKLSLRCPFKETSHPHSHAIYLVAYGESGGSGSDVIDEALRTTLAASIGQGYLADLGKQNVAAVLRVTCVGSAGAAVPV